MLPSTTQEFMYWPWVKIAPYFQELADRSLNADNIAAWLSDWSRLEELLYETYWRLYVATTVNTADETAQQRYAAFLDEIYPPAQEASQKLKEKLLVSGFDVQGFEIPLRNMRAEAAIFRQANLPLLSEELKLSNEYDKIVGAQTVQWEGKELTIQQLHPVYQDPDREKRERAWRLAIERQLADRQAINALWVKFMEVRGKLAANADFSDYRAYRWQQLLRFDYTPKDCASFHAAIEEVIVPAARRIYETRRQQLSLDTLRPWDLIDGWYGSPVDPFKNPPLRPFARSAELESKTAAIFQRVDPQLGEHFDIMRREGLLDLENRKNKAPGGYCTEFEAARRPFIFMNAVGIHDDVQTLLHEGGHAFHSFESNALPYRQQRSVPIEFAEVASMGMEFLAAPYLSNGESGFYTPEEAARAHAQHVEFSLLFWPFMAVVDGFQHWVYTHHADASDPANCDAKWAELWARFIPVVDWSGFETAMVAGWQRKAHIHQSPFYYVEYGLAQLGAMQIWRNARKDQSAAVAAYRKALSLGGTAPLPELFAAAGARFAFDSAILREVIELALQRF
jgi:oligoendopeptidase F